MFFPGQEVQGEIDLGVVAMGLAHGRLDFGKGKSVGLGAQAQGLAAQIHGVGAIAQGGAEFVRIADRDEEFGK